LVFRPGLDGSCTRRRDERWRMRSDMGSLHGLRPAARSAGPCCRWTWNRCKQPPGRIPSSWSARGRRRRHRARPPLRGTHPVGSSAGACARANSVGL